MKITFLGNEVTLKNKQINTGDILKDFKALNSAFTCIKTENIKGKKLLLSIPSIDTSVCTVEVIKFNEYLKERDIEIIVVSMDLPFTIASWKSNNSQCNNILILSDTKYREFGKLTGTVVKELGILTRAVFVLDESNKVLYSEYLNEISDEPNYEKVLEILDK